MGSEPGERAARPAEAAAKTQDTDRAESFHYQAAQQEVARVLDAIGNGLPLAIGTLQRIVAGMARTLAGGDDRLLLQASESGPVHIDLPRHMVNTAIFAIKIAQGMGCQEEELPWLGLAACLHDVGMLVLPKRILDKPEPLSDEERVLLQRHPEKGFRALQALGSEFEWLANVALQEHEREDGSGYPRSLKGEEIHEYAKIVGLADMYEALTHPRPHRKMRVAFDVVKELIGTERQRFPDRLLKGLIRGLSTFPVGSYIRLNSMEFGRIVGTNPAFPLRPVVEIIAGSTGQGPESPRRVDLSANTLLYITEACSFERPTN